MLTRRLAIAPLMKFKTIYLLLTTVPFWLCTFQQVVSAQLSTAPKPSAPTPTNIKPAISSGTQVANENHPNQFDITGGQTSNGSAPNVVHQFTDFDVRDGDQANFVVTPDVANVISLINSADASSIYGQLQITTSTGNVADGANLILVNPAGIVFGETARLNLHGDLTATTATGLLFADTYHLSIDGSVSSISLPNSNSLAGNTNAAPDVANLTGAPTGYFFIADPSSTATINPLSTELPTGSIHNKGTLALSTPSTLTLLGRYVQNDGDLETSGGTVNLVAVPGDNLVRLSQPNNILSVEVISTDAILLNTSTGIAEALTGGSDLGANQIETEADGSQTLTDTFSLMSEPGEVLVRGTIDVSDSDGEGTVNIAGENINLVDSDINVDGSQKAGIISIGNDEATGITTITTSVDRSSNLSADSTDGEGGVIRIRATETIEFYGDATVNGASPTLEGTVDFQADETDVR